MSYYDVYIILDTGAEQGYHSTNNLPAAKAWLYDAMQLTDVTGGYVVDAESNKIIASWGRGNAVSSRKERT